MNKTIMITGLHSTLDKVRTFDKIKVYECNPKRDIIESLYVYSEDEYVAGMTIKTDYKFEISIESVKKNMFQYDRKYWIEFSMNCGTVNSKSEITKEEYDAMYNSIIAKQENVFTKIFK
jgi:hypothetical protein